MAYFYGNVLFTHRPKTSHFGSDPGRPFSLVRITLPTADSWPTGQGYLSSAESNFRSMNQQIRTMVTDVQKGVCVCVCVCALAR